MYVNVCIDFTMLLLHPLQRSVALFKAAKSLWALDTALCFSTAGGLGVRQRDRSGIIDATPGARGYSGKG